MKRDDWDKKTVTVTGLHPNPIDIEITPRELSKILEEIDDDTFVNVVVEAAQLNRARWAAFIAEVNRDNE